MQPLVLDPQHPLFPKEPELPEEINSSLRAGLVGWLTVRLEELEGDCIIRTKDEEAGILEAFFPAMPAVELKERLAERNIFCTLGEKHSIRFTLSAGQAFEPIDTLQAVLCELLEIE